MTFSIWHIIILFVGLSIYLIPTWIASMRGHPKWVPIFLVNVFLGGSVIGWFWALAWSLWPFEQDAEPAHG